LRSQSGLWGATIVSFGPRWIFAKIALFHSAPYQPQSRGKCEHWFRVMRGQFLYRWREEDLGGPNQALRGRIEETYSSTGSFGDQPDAFGATLRPCGECLGPVPHHLKYFFRKRALRTVTKDKAVVLNGNL
jgi:hypothetical protein